MVRLESVSSARLGIGIGSSLSIAVFAYVSTTEANGIKTCGHWSTRMNAGSIDQRRIQDIELPFFIIVLSTFEHVCPRKSALCFQLEESLEEMSIHRKLMTGCAVAVLTFGLAACGGGSDNTADERDSLQDQINALQTAYGADPLTPAGITELQAALGTAQTALEAATAGLAAATAEVMGLQTEVEGLMATLGGRDRSGRG